MSETPPEPSGSLTDNQAAHLTACVNALINQNFIVGPNEAYLTDVREDSRLDLVHALVEPDSNDAAAELIVETHDQSPSSESISSLYAYWGIYQDIRINHPESTIPNAFISFAEDLARHHGETDMAVELLSMYTEEVVESEDKEAAAISPVDKQVAESRLALFALGEDTLLHLEDMQFVAMTSLNVKTDPQSTSDAVRLMQKIGMTNMLRIDIRGGIFQTAEGIRAACTHHDRELLTAQNQRPTELLSLINNKQFITPEGLAAAQAQQDRDRLMILHGRPTDLRGDIAANRFITPEGLAAAQAQHDHDQLENSTGNPTDLLATIMNGHIYTPIGLAAACEQQDGDRLMLHRSDRYALQADLNNNSFLTDEGREAALKILGLATNPY